MLYHNRSDTRYKIQDTRILLRYNFYTANNRCIHVSAGVILRIKILIKTGFRIGRLSSAA